MKNNFKFDPDTGTMKLVTDNNVEKPEEVEVSEEREFVFKESDHKMFQILNEDTHAVMGYIAGFDLDISFNLKELNSVDKIERFVNALQNLFRKIITDQILGNK